MEEGSQVADAEEASVWLRTRASLLSRLQGTTDSAAWTEFYDMYWRAIYGYALRFGMCKEDAEDIVQEVFIKLLRRLPAFTYDREKGRFLAWLKTITRNAVTDLYRRRQARIEGGKRLEPGEDGKAPVEGLADPEAASTPDPWQEEWELSILATALERIRPNVKQTNYEAFRLYALENKPAHEVANLLGITRNTVFIAKNRILQLLQQEVARLKVEAM